MLEHMFIFGVIVPTVVTIILFIAFLVCWFKFNMREKIFGKKQLHSSPSGGVTTIPTVATSRTQQDSPDPCRQNTLNSRHNVYNVTSQVEVGDTSSTEDPEVALYDQNTTHSNSNNEVHVFYNPNLVSPEAGTHSQLNNKQNNQSRHSSHGDPDMGQPSSSSFPYLYKDSKQQGNVYTDFVPISELLNDGCHDNTNPHKYTKSSFGHNMSHVRNDYNSSLLKDRYTRADSKISTFINVNDVGISVA